MRAPVSARSTKACRISKNAPLRVGFGLHELRELGFQAIFLSIGTQRGRDLKVEGSQLDGVVKAVDFDGIALLLTLAFLSLGSLLAVFGATRTRAFGLALFVWSFLVLFYDLLVIGAGFLLKERAANMLIFVSLFGNPVDAARVAGLISMGDATLWILTSIRTCQAMRWARINSNGSGVPAPV